MRFFAIVFPASLGIRHIDSEAVRGVLVTSGPLIGTRLAAIWVLFALLR